MFQVLSGHIWLVAAELDSAALQNGLPLKWRWKWRLKYLMLNVCTLETS